MLEMFAGAFIFACGVGAGFYVGVSRSVPDPPPRVPRYGSVNVLDKAVYPEWETDEQA